LKAITDLAVFQIRVFQVDVIPFNQISLNVCTDKIRSDLNIQGIEQGQGIGGVNQIVFRKGDIKGENGQIIINGITIEPRRVILDILGSSHEANLVYNKLVTAIGAVISLDLSKLNDPLIKAETTRCAVDLEFSFWSLLSDKFANFINKRVQKSATTELADASILPLSIDVEINYVIKDETLKQSRVGMTPKKLSISLRTGTTLESQRYLISSPFDSDTHLILIKELEATLGKGIKKESVD
jgi:hypothetical protein